MTSSLATPTSDSYPPVQLYQLTPDDARASLECIICTHSLNETKPIVKIPCPCSEGIVHKDCLSTWAEPYQEEGKFLCLTSAHEVGLGVLANSASAVFSQVTPSESSGAFSFTFLEAASSDFPEEDTPAYSDVFPDRGCESLEEFSFAPLNAAALARLSLGVQPKFSRRPENSPADSIISSPPSYSLPPSYSSNAYFGGSERSLSGNGRSDVRPYRAARREMILSSCQLPSSVEPSLPPQMGIDWMVRLYARLRKSGESDKFASTVFVLTAMKPDQREKALQELEEGNRLFYTS